MNDQAGFDAFSRTAEDDARIALVVDQWGESFHDLALNARLRFEGEEIVVVLWKPIQVGGATAAELRIREPDLDDLAKIDGVKGDIAQTKRLVVSTCSITDREAGKIGLRDIALLGRLLQCFSGAAPATGALR